MPRYRDFSVAQLGSHRGVSQFGRWRGRRIDVHRALRRVATGAPEGNLQGCVRRDGDIRRCEVKGLVPLGSIPLSSGGTCATPRRDVFTVAVACTGALVGISTGLVLHGFDVAFLSRNLAYPMRYQSHPAGILSTRSSESPQSPCSAPSSPPAAPGKTASSTRSRTSNPRPRILHDRALDAPIIREPGEGPLVPTCRSEATAVCVSEVRPPPTGVGPTSLVSSLVGDGLPWTRGR
jgi:hypothetical protein